VAACDVVIPCRDEAPALPDLLSRIPRGFHPIVVDNGSRDATAEVARSLGATVVVEPRPGYGAAVHAGLEAATADYVAVIDGDGSMDPVELVDLLGDVTDGLADLAVGRRRPSARGVRPWHARAGNAVVLWWLRRRIGMPLHDIAPMRVARRKDLLALGIVDRRFGYPVELLQRATAANWRFVERDISYYPRAAGTRSKVSGSLIGTIRATRDFARVLS
jgi:glycosyltransferase involved in cell wall biosynthesis